MSQPNFLQLAAVIKAMQAKKSVTRTRLQKTMWLLQELGFPTDYIHYLHFYGPYSEEIQGDIGLLESYGLLVEETGSTKSNGGVFFSVKVPSSATVPEIDSRWLPSLQMMCAFDTVALELAATYGMLRSYGQNEVDALKNLKSMKSEKCSASNLVKMRELLSKLEIV